jgi:hypothetical protein
MFGSTILEIGIGVVFVFLLISLISSSLNELVAWVLGLRAKTLKEGIDRLLADPAIQGLSERLYTHPLVKPLAKPGKIPSYIPSRTFALALIDEIIATRTPAPGPITTPGVASAGAGTGTGVAPAAAATGGAALALPLRLADVHTAIAALPENSEVRKALMLVVNGSITELTQARESIEKWFDEAMERVSGWYKRKTQIILFCWAALIAGLFNVDTLYIVRQLLHDSALRTALVAQAEATVNQPLNNTSGQDLSKVTANLNDSVSKLSLLPIGWQQPAATTSTADGSAPAQPALLKIPTDVQGWAQKVVGLLLTIVATLMGAPFWFDVLNKFINMRAGGKPPQSTAKPATT